MIQRLKRLVHYDCHRPRFPAYGVLCERDKVDLAEPNDELFRRFYLDVVEDQEGFAHLDSGGNSPGRFKPLADYFRQWLEGVDTGSGAALENEPRFHSCLVVDAESLATLAAELYDELPPLRCAVSRQEKADSLSPGCLSWMWLLGTKYMAQPASHEVSYPGWLRVSPDEIRSAWFTHMCQNDTDRWFRLFHKEKPEGSGIWYYSEEP